MKSHKKISEKYKSISEKFLRNPDWEGPPSPQHTWKKKKKKNHTKAYGCKISKQ